MSQFPSFLDVFYFPLKNKKLNGSQNQTIPPPFTKPIFQKQPHNHTPLDLSRVRGFIF